MNTELFELFSEMDQWELDQHFNDACRENNLEQIQYLLTSPDLEIHADIRNNENLGFRLACKEGNLQIVKYLLTSPEIMVRPDIRSRNDYGLKTACSNKHYDMLRFLIEDGYSFEEKDANYDIAFKAAFNFRRPEAIQFLIYELDINKSPAIIEHIQNNPGELADKAEHMFKVRDMNKQLEAELSVKKSSQSNLRKI
jgi:ankyrin repeat protein